MSRPGSLVHHSENSYSAAIIPALACCYIKDISNNSSVSVPVYLVFTVKYTLTHTHVKYVWSQACRPNSHEQIPEIGLEWKQPGWHVNYAKHAACPAPGLSSGTGSSLSGIVHGLDKSRAIIT